MTFVFVCLVQYILMQQEFGGLGRILLGELPTPILQVLGLESLIGRK